MADGLPTFTKEPLEIIKAAIKSDTEKKAQKQLDDQEELLALQRQVNTATQTALQINRIQQMNRLNQQMRQLNQMTQMMNAMSLGSAFGGGLGFDPSSFWQPIIDASNFSTQ